MFKCKVVGCFEKANYNKKYCFNPVYCYEHKTKDMYKIGKYDRDDIVEIIFVSLENILFGKEKEKNDKPVET